MRVFIFYFLLFEIVSADLPVHCLRPQVEGKWRFHLSAPTKHRSTCGHHTPDIDKKQPNLQKFEASKTIEVALKDPSNAELSLETDEDDHGTSLALLQKKGDNDDASSDNEDDQDIDTENVPQNKSADENEDNKTHQLNSQKHQSADWTMIYDEGISVKSEEFEFFSFSHFQIPDQTTVHGKKLYRSFCGKTEIGWYYDREHDEYGCWKGEKVETSQQATYHLSLLDESLESQKLSKFLSTEGEQKKKFDSLSMRQHQEIVENINNEQSTWKATVYTESFMQQKIGQFLKKAAVKLAKNGFSANGLEQTSSAKTKTFPSNLPKEYNWNNVNGTDWLEPVLDQADCGSCYAVSSVHMLSARFRIFKKDPKVEGLSINFPLYCSDLNQGCNGGYPSLVSMFSRHVGMVPKSCTGKYFTSESATCKDAMKRPDVKKFDQCVNDAANEKRLAAVSKWNYIGGYYGGCSVGKMMTDLFHYGPVAVALEPAMDFMYYRSGIYKSTSVKTNVPWVKVDHAVLLIGWGEELDGEDSKTPYWTIQNSWGKEWGEHGNIRLIRGENESGVEFQAVSARVGLGKPEKVLSYVQGIMEL